MRKYFYLSTLFVLFLFAIAIITTVPITVQAIDEVTATPSSERPIEATPTPVPDEPTSIPEPVEATPTSVPDESTDGSDEVDVEALMDEGITDLQEGRFRAAIAKMDTVLEVDPNNTTAYFIRGVSYMQLSQYDNAIDDFTSAIELEPWDVELYVWRGDAFNLQGDTADALLDYEMALMMDSTSVAVLSRRSEVYYQLGDNQAGDTDDLIVRGLEAAASNDILSGLDILTEAVDSANSDSSLGYAYYARGIVYFSTGDDDAAIEDFTLATEANPELHHAYLILGIMYRENGDIAEAGQALYQRITTLGIETLELDTIIGETVDIEMAYRRIYAISFEGEAGQVVTISARDTGFTLVDPLIALVAPDGEAIAGDDDFGGNLDSLIEDFELPQDGTYTLYVGHAEGGYDFGFEGVVRVDIDG